MGEGERLWRRVATAVDEYERQLGPLGGDDLEGLDAFHAGGRAATHALAALAGLLPGARVLDIGCGLGGPARTLALEYDACVTGLDRSLEMIRAGAYLNHHLRVSGSPWLMCADGAGLPLAPDCYDIVWMQHLLASVDDKAALLTSVDRVMAPEGILALHEVIVLPDEKLDFPLPWAGSPQESFLLEEEALLDLFTQAGLDVVTLSDWTAPALDWFASPRPKAWRYLNLKLILGEEAGLRARNLTEGLKSGRAKVIQAVLRRSE